MNIFFIICSFVLGCSFVQGKLLAVQKIGAGYPSFHVINHNDDGSLSCGTYKCKNPPNYCKIESKSDASLQKLITKIECKDAAMKTTDRWTLNQKSPKPGIKLDILTEADIKQTINNKKNIESGGGGGTNIMTSAQRNQLAQMNSFFNAMKNQNPFMSLNNNGMFAPQG